MATFDTIAGLPEELQRELEKTARAQGRLVGEVLSDAVSAYLHERSWQNLIESGRKRASELGLAEDDVPRLIVEARSEQRLMDDCAAEIQLPAEFKAALE